MATDSRLVTIQRELTVCKEQSDKYLTQRDKLAGELRASRETVQTSYFFMNKDSKQDSGRGGGKPEWENLYFFFIFF